MKYELTVTRRIPVQWTSERSENRPLVSIMKDGKPVEGVDPERIKSVSIEEEVLKLTNAGHIHAWFVRNVAEAEETCGSVRITLRVLDDLLATCEKVLFASQLVPRERFSQDFYRWTPEVKAAVGDPHKVVRNVNVAHRELPATSRYGGSGEYDADYISQVEETRMAIARLKSEGSRSSMGDLYFAASRCYN